MMQFSLLRKWKADAYPQATLLKKEKNIINWKRDSSGWQFWMFHYTQV